MEVSHKEKTTRVRLAAPQGNEEPSGPHIEALPIIAGEALPYEMVLRNYAMVCHLLCSVVEILPPLIEIRVRNALRCVNFRNLHFRCSSRQPKSRWMMYIL